MVMTVSATSSHTSPAVHHGCQMGQLLLSDLHRWSLPHDIVDRVGEQREAKPGEKMESAEGACVKKTKLTQ
jgi:hypothetical protein